MTTRRSATNRFAIAALALLLALLRQSPVSAAESIDCPGTGEIAPSRLQGLWEFRLWPLDGHEEHPLAQGVMLLRQHPEYADSVRGELRLAGPSGEARAQVAGDVSDGLFQMDESDDGQRISAVWEGQPAPCGDSIRGQRRQTERADTAPTITEFLLIQRPD